jgi:2-oxo-4-hydroxy-4-carboxy-5-ureidoimidazoline decarboxylase
MGGESLGERAGLERLNGLPDDAAREELLACCSSARWAAEVASGRPFASASEIMARSDAAVAGLTQADLEQALAGHPRIGGRSRAGAAAGSGAAADSGAAAGHRGHEGGAAAAWSRQEQAGVQAADQATTEALAEGNEAYERRFGHIYLVCATGRSGAELLALLRERLGNDPAAEWDVVRRELGKINRIRLRKLLEATDERHAMSAVTTHVLDTARGVPAAGVQVWLEQVSPAGRTEIARTRTGSDGRAASLGPQRLAPGTYRLVFDTAEYFAVVGGGGEGGARDRAAFFPEVAITFTADSGDGEVPHYHVPLLLSPFGYATYRGS